MTELVEIRKRQRGMVRSKENVARGFTRFGDAKWNTKLRIRASAKLYLVYRRK